MNNLDTIHLSALLAWINTHDTGREKAGIIEGDSITIQIGEKAADGPWIDVDIKGIRTLRQAREALGY